MRLFWLCLLLALSGVLRAAVPELPRFRVLGPGDGLPSATVPAIARDHDGFVWAATWDGLARYDGVGFKVWQHDPEDPASLPGNLIQSLYVDGRNRIWVASEGGGVSVMDTSRTGFRHFRASSHPEMESDDVFTITGRGDEVWLGTFGGGLYRIDGADQIKRMRAGDAEIDGILDRAVMGISMDAQGQTILVGTLNGLAHCADKASRVQRLPLPGSEPYPPVTALWREGDATWIGTPAGLHRLRDDGSWDTPAWATHFTARRAVTAMSGDGEGGYWLATSSGLWHVPQAGAPVAVGHGFEIPGPNSVIQALLHDEDGGLWVGLPAQGLGYLRPDWRRTAVLGPAHGFSGGAYRVVVPANGGGVWLTGNADVGGRLDTGRAVFVDTIAPTSGFIPATVRSGLHDSRGQLWLGRSGVLVRLAEDRPPRIWRNSDPVDAVNGRGPLEWILESPDGSLWLAFAGVGLQRRDLDGRVLDELVAGQVPGLDEADFASVRIGPDGTPWVAEGPWILRWDAVARAFVPLPGVTPPSDGATIHSFVLDGAERLWVQRLSGLELWRRASTGWRQELHLGVAEGIPATEATGMRVDGERRLWLTTRRGLYRIDPPVDGQPARVRPFGVREGLPSQEFVERALAIDQNGVLVATTSDGSLLLLDTTLPDPQPASPRLVVDSLRVRRDDAWAELPATGGFELEPGDHELEVAARLLAYDDPGSHQYRSRLLGFDSDWVEMRAGERVFSQLPPGAYRLQLQASLGHGGWSQVHEVSFAVSPPWWRSGWARLVMLLAGALVLACSAYVYRRRLRTRNQWQLALHKRELAEQASLAKSRFLATLGHEVRTPMTGVLGMSELLLGTALDARQRSYVESIRRAGEHLLRLVNDALDLARIEAGKLELDAQDFDPRALAAEVTGLMAPVAEQRGLSFKLREAPDLPAGLRGDPGRVRQILLNLLGNAVKFTDRGEVVLELAPLSPVGLVFVVRDTGPGLSEEQKARLFRRFEQADGARTTARYGGSGLGLAICQELASAMGGRIEVDSVPGHGTAFRVELPLPPASPPQAQARPANAPARPSRALDLLLVEDDATVAEVMCNLLRARGHCVAHAPNALAALADVAVAHFDLALLDLDLPGMNGLALARQLRAQGFASPLLAVTARTDGEAEQMARAAGFDGFLRKPVTGDMLAAAIASVLPEETSE